MRVIVVDGKAFGIRRLVRRGDFRASGSGSILYGKENIPLETIRLALALAVQLDLQCAAFDFVYDSAGQPKVLEVSYGFVEPRYRDCVGYWDESLRFHEGPFDSLAWMVEMLVRPRQADAERNPFRQEGQ